jgi:hypothetical protein
MRCGLFCADPNSSHPIRKFTLTTFFREITASVQLDCDVAEDMSLVCPRIKVTTNEMGEMMAEFRRAASQIIALYRAAPRTKDGKSLVGQSCRNAIRFVLD